MITSQAFRAICPKCGSSLLLGQTTGSETPVGSQCVCDACASICTIDSTLRLRLVTQKEWMGLSQHDRMILAAMQRRLMARIRHLKAEEQQRVRKLNNDTHISLVRD